MESRKNQGHIGSKVEYEKPAQSLSKKKNPDSKFEKSETVPSLQKPDAGSVQDWRKTINNSKITPNLKK